MVQTFRDDQYIAASLDFLGTSETSFGSPQSFAAGGRRGIEDDGEEWAAEHVRGCDENRDVE
jgi:hypothetical protein